jgi:hypothetical protein
MVEKINQDSKRQLALLTLLLAFIFASLTHLVHWFQVDPFGFNRIGSGIIAIFSFVYLILLYKKQTRTESSMLQYLVTPFPLKKYTFRLRQKCVLKF